MRRFLFALALLVGAGSAQASAIYGLPSITATGGSAARTLADHFSDTFSAKDFGVLCNNTADDLAAAQAAIAYVGGTNLGGRVLFPKGTCKFSNTLDNPYSNVYLEGLGSDNAHTGGPAQLSQCGTIFKWTGADGGTMLWERSPEGSGLAKTGEGGVKGICFNSGSSGAAPANNGASIAIRISSKNSGHYERIFCQEMQVVCMQFDVVTTLGDARDPQQNEVHEVQSQNTGNSGGNPNGGLLLFIGDHADPSGGGGSGGTIAGANVSLNSFSNMGGRTKDGVLYKLGNSDHNFFHDMRGQVTGTGKDWYFQGSNTWDHDVARSNTIFGFSGSGTNTCEGTDAVTYPSTDNIFYQLDHSNSTQQPVVGTGASCWVEELTDGTHWNNASVRAVIGSTQAVLNAARTRALSTTEPLRIESRNGVSVRFARPIGDASSEEAAFRCGIDTSLNYFCERVVGTGSWNIAANNNMPVNVGIGTANGGVNIGNSGNAVAITSSTGGSITTGAGSFTTVGESGAYSNTTNGALSLPAALFSGTPISGGSGTTTKPLFLIEPAGTTSTGWNTNGTYFGINVASPNTNNIVDIQIAGSSKFRINSSGIAAAVAGSMNYTEQAAAAGIASSDVLYADSTSHCLIANNNNGGATGCLVGRSSTDTLTNKTLTSPTINDATMGGTTNTIGGTTANITATTLQRSGNTVLLPRRFTTTYDPASLTAATAREDTVTVTGVTTAGGAVAVNLGVAPAAGCVIANIYVSAADTVKIDWQNTNTVAACDTASSTAVFTQAQ